MYCGEKVVGILDVGRESLDKRLEILSVEEPILETIGLPGVQVYGFWEVVKFRGSGILWTEWNSGQWNATTPHRVYALGGADLIK